MENLHAKITYLVHSGFSVETSGHFLLFDYCPSLVRNPIITSEFLKTKENIYVFVSQSCEDHFDTDILHWQKTNPSITYVFSSDVFCDRSDISCHNCHIMSAYEQWTDRAIEIKTFGSTDDAVSFLVQADGLSVFHAGHLNWWRWKGETLEEQNYAEKIFKDEVDKIVGQKIDIAFFPVVGCLGEHAALGAEYFAAKLQPKLLIPMHLAGDLGVTKAFAEKAKAKSWATVEITHDGQEILF